MSTEVVVYLQHLKVSKISWWCKRLLIHTALLWMQAYGSAAPLPFNQVRCPVCHCATNYSMFYSQTQYTDFGDDRLMGSIIHGCQCGWVLEYDLRWTQSLDICAVTVTRFEI